MPGQNGGVRQGSCTHLGRGSYGSLEEGSSAAQGISPAARERESGQRHLPASFGGDLGDAGMGRGRGEVVRCRTRSNVVVGVHGAGSTTTILSLVRSVSCPSPDLAASLVPPSWRRRLWASASATVAGPPPCATAATDAGGVFSSLPLLQLRVRRWRPSAARAHASSFSSSPPSFSPPSSPRLLCSSPPPSLPFRSVAAALGEKRVRASRIWRAAVAGFIGELPWVRRKRPHRGRRGRRCDAPRRGDTQRPSAVGSARRQGPRGRGRGRNKRRELRLTRAGQARPFPRSVA